MQYSNLSDNELETLLNQKVQQETKIQTEILYLLAETEKRRIYDKKYPSLFDYCVVELKYSHSSAQRRIDTMRALKVIPELETKIQTGALNMTTISLAQKFFRSELKLGKKVSLDDKKNILKSIENKSAKESIKQFVTISPEAILFDRRRELSEYSTELKMAVSSDVLKKLDRLKELLSNKYPTLKDSELVGIMVDICLEKLDPLSRNKSKDKKSLKKSSYDPHATNDSPNSQSIKNTRYISSALRQEIWLRDKGQCTYRNPETNEPCSSRHFLEIDHIIPLSMGGITEVTNLRLLCRTHNLRHAINTLGPQKMGFYM